MSYILKYFSFLCQLKGHKVSNKLVMYDFDLKFGYKNGLLADSEALCMCSCSFNFILTQSFLLRKLRNCSLSFIPLTFDLDIFPNTSIWEISHQTILSWGTCVEAFHQISASQIECKWKKASFEGQSFRILLKSYPILSIDQDLVHHQIKFSCRPHAER